jgi:hypothetical protein
MATNEGLTIILVLFSIAFLAQRYTWKMIKIPRMPANTRYPALTSFWPILIRFDNL